ncbi:Rz1-like lysis system protein LysC [Erwinia typographi]|uniref:Rz1-like lysis system protein LysC n=1 Tax=Erwinia typographi TaxID=371042 RepID=UPI001E308CA9|nr:Rz1-like lysis system protein LysC [Erwinia typographi]
MLLSGCTQGPHSPEVNLTVSGCPKITRCRLASSAPKNNGDLSTALDEAEAAWANCADKVDTIVTCQEKDDEQAAVLTKSPDQCRALRAGQSRSSAPVC